VAGSDDDRPPARQASGATAPMLGLDNKTTDTSRKWGSDKTVGTRTVMGKAAHGMDASDDHCRCVGQIAAV
jgi:hypothetical protein